MTETLEAAARRAEFDIELEPFGTLVRKIVSKINEVEQANLQGGPFAQLDIERAVQKIINEDLCKRLQVFIAETEAREQKREQALLARIAALEAELRDYQATEASRPQPNDPRD